MHLNRLNDGASIGKIRSKNIEGQNDHREVGAGDLDEQLIISGADLSDFAAVDDGWKGQDLSFCIPENGQAALRPENVAIL
jgi:hypothetical protein